MELYLRYDNVNSLVVNSLDGVQTLEAEKESFELGEIYALSDVIPGTWFVRDIIKDLTFIFNLAWETNVLARKVYAYPKDDYYLKYRPNATGTTVETPFTGFFKNSDQYDLVARGVKDNEVKLIDSYKSTTVLAYATDDDTTEAEEKRRDRKTGLTHWVQIAANNHYLDCEQMQIALSSRELYGGVMVIKKPIICTRTNTNTSAGTSPAQQPAVTGKKKRKPQPQPGGGSNPFGGFDSGFGGSY